MIQREVVLSARARANLVDLTVWIATQASAEIAFQYVERVEAHVLGFDIASERGTLHDDVLPGLRTVGFEGRLTIAFTVTEATVTILGVFRAGQDWSAILAL